MSRQPDGQVMCRKNGSYGVRVFTGPGRKAPVFDLVGCRSRDEATERAREIASIASRMRLLGCPSATARTCRALAAQPSAIERATLLDVARAEIGQGGGSALFGGTTLSALFARWNDGSLHREFPLYVTAKDARSHRDDRSRFDKWIAPSLGAVAVRDFTQAHYDKVISAVPERGRFHVAQVLIKLLAYAVKPLGIITRSPLPEGSRPARPLLRDKSALLPSEEAKLLACGAVPWVRRLLYAVCAREGLTKAEARDLRWSQIDFREGAIRLSRGIWALGSDVVAALSAFASEQRGHGTDERVFRDIANWGHIADVLREDLRSAGIVRPELFRPEGDRLTFRFHDLRTSFVTVAIASGKREAWVLDRMGLSSFDSIARCRRIARHLTEIGETTWFADMAAVSA